MTRREFAARAGLGAASVALTLVAAEIALRLCGPKAEGLRLEQFAHLVEDRHRFAAERIFEADPELFWRLAPNVTLPDDARPLFGVISNDEGLREDHPLDVPKPDGEIRILFVGDSCTFGYLVGHAETFVAFAESALRARFPSARIECINAGVPGYTLFQGWRFVETRGPRLDPDLVVLNFGWNEQVSWDGRGDPEHYELLQKTTPIRPLRASRLAELAWRARFVVPSQPTGTEFRPRLLPYEYRRIQEQVAETAARLGADLLLLVGGARANVTGATMRDYRTPLQEEQIRFGRQARFGPQGDVGYVSGVDVLAAMASERPVSEIFFDEIHTTPAANRLLGQELATRIEPWLAARLRARE